MHISSLDVDANSMANRRINSPSSQDMASNGKCIAILKTGERKGQMCGATAKFGSPTLIYCGRHNGYLGGDTPSSGGHTPPPGPGRSATPSQISQPTPLATFLKILLRLLALPPLVAQSQRHECVSWSSSWLTCLEGLAWLH